MCWVCVLVQPEMLANAILQVTPILSFTGRCGCLCVPVERGGGKGSPCSLTEMIQSFVTDASFASLITLKLGMASRKRNKVFCYAKNIE